MVIVAVVMVAMVMEAMVMEAMVMEARLVVDLSSAMAAWKPPSSRAPSRILDAFGRFAGGMSHESTSTHALCKCLSLGMART
eukprot:15453052-Alexandrium_andersonii.AAC.1